ncbi:MAG: septum formation protein Maf [Clostridia bacterium]|nr:septum formation protein Maf [Clostridia bacterium]
MRYILASRSPRRREILTNIGIDFTVVTADTDETSSLSDPSELAEELARRKGRAAAELLSQKGELSEDDVIISADTVVFCGGEILGKPRDRTDAKRMLRLLSGNSHTVVSGVALIKGGESFVSHSETKVYFDKLSESEINDYVDTDEPFDKAGAYGIQGRASLWINRIEGCYFGVVGFPVNLFNDLHRKCLGYPVL